MQVCMPMAWTSRASPLMVSMQPLSCGLTLRKRCQSRSLKVGPGSLQCCMPCEDIPVITCLPAAIVFRGDVQEDKRSSHDHINSVGAHGSVAPVQGNPMSTWLQQWQTMHFSSMSARCRESIILSCASTCRPCNSPQLMAPVTLH